MITYLIIGIALFIILIGDSNDFFYQMGEGRDEILNEYPQLSPRVVNIGLGITCIVMWLIWPVTITYVMMRLNS